MTRNIHLGPHQVFNALRFVRFFYYYFYIHTHITVTIGQTLLRFWTFGLSFCLMLTFVLNLEKSCCVSEGLLFLPRKGLLSRNK